MMGQRGLMIGAAASTSVLGLAMTSGLLMFASRLVEEFSHPHVIPDIEEFNLHVPLTEPEPPRSLQRSLTFQTRDGKLIWRLLGATTACPHYYSLSRLSC